MTARTVYTAERARGRAVLAGSCTLAGLLLWLVHHLMAPYAHGLATLYTVSVLALVWQLGLAVLERPMAGDPGPLKVVAAVPVYNEDPALLTACLDSLLAQMRPPEVIVVVDDGSTTSDYAGIRDRFLRGAAEAGVDARWRRTPNRGKRRAQGVAVRETPDADVYLTVDSDTILDPAALAEGLAPFASPRVMSVAGVCLVANNRGGLLARICELWFVGFQTVERSGQSVMGAVIVNSGFLAFYRAEIVRDNLDGYLNETFLGREVSFSDDSMLTLYAMMRGRTVQQPTCVAFTLAPETLSHRLRQFVRWCRGSFIRTWWRLRYLPLGSYAYWAHLVRTVQFPLYTFMFACVVVVRPLIGHRLALDVVTVTVLLSYLQNLRYLTFRRADQGFPSQFLTYALSPLCAVWASLVLRPVRWYAIATCLRTGWGTRADGVEVGLAPAAGIQPTVSSM